MTTEIKELAADLNDLQILPPMECIEDYNNAHGRKLYGRAADAIEALVGEVERLRAEVKWREDETALEVVAARDCEKSERAKAEAAEAEVERLKGEAEELRKATIRVMASLAGAISLLERGGKAAKKAAPSDNMFAQMLDDYSRALDAVRDLLNALEAKP